MAGSRVDKAATIFARVTGMIRAGGTKWDDRPLWYDVYAAFPPRYEPRHNREVPKDVTIRKLMYPEDELRAEFYRTYGSPGIINMTDEGTPSVCETFLKKYVELANKHPNRDADEVFTLTANALTEQGTIVLHKRKTRTPTASNKSEDLKHPEAMSTQ